MPRNQDWDRSGSGSSSGSGRDAQSRPLSAIQKHKVDAEVKQYLKIRMKDDEKLTCNVLNAKNIPETTPVIEIN